MLATLNPTVATPMENEPQTLLALREFNLVTQPSATAANPNNPSNITGLYLSSFHTGAGDSALVGTRNVSQARSFYLNATFLDDDIASTYIPQGTFAIGLQTYAPPRSSAPSGLLDTTDAASESHTPGFGVGDGDVVQYEGDLAFASFVVCWVQGITPYNSVGPQFQVLWRNRTGTEVDGEGCGDVDLKAVFLS